jgi:hypothetical protein
MIALLCQGLKDYLMIPQPHEKSSDAETHFSQRKIQMRDNL